MKIKFGINFEFKIDRDMPQSAWDQQDSEVSSHVDRSPDTDWVADSGETIGKGVAPLAKRVVGFVGNPPGRTL